MGITINVQRNWLLSPWTVALFGGSLFSVLGWYFALWDFLDAFHPWVLAGVAVLLTLWLLYALSPKITVHLMRLLDITLPRGDSGVPLVGSVVRLAMVLAGPALIYLSLMALREGAPRGWEVAAAILLGFVLGSLSWRSVSLILIMREHYLEDEVRKGILDTGAYNDNAIRKLEQATQEILAEPNLDKKRIRLRRLAATDRVLRNKNYDPHQIEHGGITDATVGGLERERHVDWARRSRKGIGMQADVEDAKLRSEASSAEADRAGHEARKRQFDGQSQGRGPRRDGKTLEDELRSKLSAKIELYQARDQVVKEKREEMEKAGVPPTEIARRISLLEAELDEIIARIMSEE